MSTICFPPAAEAGSFTSAEHAPNQARPPHWQTATSLTAVRERAVSFSTQWLIRKDLVQVTNLGIGHIYGCFFLECVLAGRWGYRRLCLVQQAVREKGQYLSLLGKRHEVNFLLGFS